MTEHEQDEGADEQQDAAPDIEDAEDAPASSDSGDDAFTIGDLELPVANAIGIEPASRSHAYVPPGALTRRFVWLQLLLVVLGAAPWIALLHYGVDLAVLELAWFFAAGIGIALGISGHARHLRWQSAFGWITAAVPLGFQMRGADLLLGTSLGTFDALLVGFVGAAIVLGAATLREIEAVG